MAIEMRKGQVHRFVKMAFDDNEELRIHTDWERGEAAPIQKINTGDGQLNPNAVDVDLGALYELKNGRKSVVQALDTFGNLDRAPWIKLDGDDRTGDTDGENITGKYGLMLQHIKRLGIFVGIYEGADSLEHVRNAVTTLYVPGNAPVVIRHEGDAHTTKFCAIALLENIGDRFSVRMDVEPIHGNQSAVDRFWGWGMQWQSRRK